MKKHITSFRLLSLALVAIAAFGLSACGNTATSPASASVVNNLPAQTESTASSEPVRSISYTMLLSGEETTVYLDVSDEEIMLWDSSSGGKMLAVAKYAQLLPGAAEGLQNCDFTDLDADGNSELTANFVFSDGTGANLTWFYANGGFVYNEEFSVLPGESPTGTAE